MSFQINSFDIDDKGCWLCIPEHMKDEKKLPLIIMPGEAEMRDMLPQIFETVYPAILDGRCKSFVLAGFESSDWNRDFSPWPAPALSRKSEAFAGKADETLAWMLGTFLKKIESAYPVLPKRDGRAILGYSLGGLFALWAILKSGQFSGAASCSGSLWYNDWMDFAMSYRFLPESRIYLSLGRSEEKARNPRMAAVGNVTRAYAEMLKNDANVLESTLVWHEGGHFQDVPERLTDAMLWLMKAND